MAAAAEVQAARESDYAPMDRETAELLAEYLDQIIDFQLEQRSAVCSEESFDEWFETSVLLADMNKDMYYIWPPTQQRLMLRRTHERGVSALGETYNVIMEWRVLNEYLTDPAYSKNYVLFLPLGHDAEVPKLLTCHQQSSFIESPNGAELTVAVNESSYHEIDVALRRGFYDGMTMGTQYDAENFFDELTLFGDMLSRG